MIVKNIIKLLRSDIEFISKSNLINFDSKNKNYKLYKEGLYKSGQVWNKNFFTYKFVKSINDGIYPGYLRVYVNKINNDNSIKDFSEEYISNLEKKIKSSIKIGNFKNTSYLFRLLSLFKN